jgi:hypothetical protein
MNPFQSVRRFVYQLQELCGWSGLAFLLPAYITHTPMWQTAVLSLLSCAAVLGATYLFAFPPEAYEEDPAVMDPDTPAEPTKRRRTRPPVRARRFPWAARLIFRKSQRLIGPRWACVRLNLSNTGWSWSFVLGPLSWNTRSRALRMDVPGPFSVAFGGRGSRR